MAQPPPIPHCGDGRRPRAAGICTRFAAVPRLAVGDPVRARILAVWHRVARPFEAISGRETAVALLAPEALNRGNPFPPAAYICPGGPPIVYVP